METHTMQDSPKNYDWTPFTRRIHGFRREWALKHGFSPVTLAHLINGYYQGHAGPKIQRMIQAALADGLIVPLNNQQGMA